MKILRIDNIDEAGQPRELDLVDCAEIAAALQERFPDLGAYDVLRGAFAMLEGKDTGPDAALH